MNEHAATELKLYINNDGRLYEQMTKGILRSLVAKKTSGQYKHDLAVKAFGYLTEAGAKKYVKDYGTSDKLFDVATRKRVSEELTKAFERAHAGGEYNWLLPVKARGSRSDHARKKSCTSAPSSHAHKAATVEGVTVETMPDYLRGSHQAASNWGTYPHNGAVREHVSLEEAEEIVASDPDGYAHIVTTRTKGSSHARKRGSTYDTSAKAQAARSARLSAKRLQPTTLAKIERDDIPSSSLLRLRAIEARRAANTAKSISSTSGGISARDIWEFRGFLRKATDRQLQGIYEKEKRAGCDEYVEATRDEAGRRSVELYEDSGGARSDHARKKRLDREILQVVPSYRWRP